MVIAEKAEANEKRGERERERKKRKQVNSSDRGLETKSNSLTLAKISTKKHTKPRKLFAQIEANALEIEKPKLGFLHSVHTIRIGSSEQQKFVSFSSFLLRIIIIRSETDQISCLCDSLAI